MQQQQEQEQEQQATVHRVPEKKGLVPALSPTQGGGQGGKRPKRSSSSQGEGNSDPLVQVHSLPSSGLNEEEKMLVPRLSPSQGGVAGAESPRRSSPFQEGHHAGLSFRAEISSLPGLDKLTGDNPDALEDIQRLTEALAGGLFSRDAERGVSNNLKELDMLVTLASDLGEMAVSDTCVANFR